MRKVDYKKGVITAEIILTTDQTFEDYDLVVGFPGTGLVGVIASSHLVRALNMREIGYLTSEFFAPTVEIIDGLPHATARIYESPEKKLLVLVCKQGIPLQAIYDLGQTIVDFAKKRGIKRIISLGGILQTEVAEGVFGIATDEKGKKLLEEHGITPVKSGMTTGISAVILLICRYLGMEALSILAPSRLREDFRAAAEVLKKLSELLGFEIDVEILENEAKRIETQLKASIKKMHELKTKYQETQEFLPLYG